MKQGAQKEKGSAYERVIAGLLTEAYYPEGDGEARRVPLSGGFDPRLVPGDLMMLKRVSNDSDAMVIDQSWPFSVECKNWGDIGHFFKGLYSAESQLYDWIEQACGDARHAKKMPLVVFKLYRQEHVAMLLDSDFHRITALFGRFSGKIYTLRRYEKGDIPDLGTRLVTDDLMFCLLKDFLGWIDWEHFRLAGKVKFLRSIIKKND